MRSLKKLTAALAFLAVFLGGFAIFAAGLLGRDGDWIILGPCITAAACAAAYLTRGDSK